MLDDPNTLNGENNEEEIQRFASFESDGQTQGACSAPVGVARDPAEEETQEVSFPQQIESFPQTADGWSRAVEDTVAPQELILPPPQKSERSEARSLYEDKGLIPGGFWVRCFAAMLDAAISGFISVCGYLACTNLFGNAAGRAFFFDIPLGSCFGILFAAAYRVLMTRLAGATLGKIALRLKVVDVSTGGELTWWQAFFREVFGRTFSSMTVIGNLMIFGSEHRTLNDRLSDTCVVYR